MSGMNNQGNYSRYDEMTTLQLREILRKHAHDELETEMDTDELFYIMEVLSDREKTNPDKQIKSAEEAWAIFVKHYAPEMEEKKPIRFHTAPRWMRRVAVVAVVFVSLTAAAVSAKAFAPGFWDKVASWTREVFCFEEFGRTEGQDPDKENRELVSLQEAVAQYNIAQPVVPKWIPEGYVSADLKILRSPKEITISAVYEKDNDPLIIKIRQTVGANPQQIEKNDSLIEVYTVGETEYYIFDNNGALQAVWVIDEFECIIGGNVSMEDMKKIIESI